MENSKYVRPTNVVTSDTVHATYSTEMIENSLREHGSSAGKGLALFGIMYCARRSLPYGQWDCVDGRAILFNREYQPIIQRHNGMLSYCDHFEWVNLEGATVTYFYDDSTSPMNYLGKHLGRSCFNSADCRKSLLICLDKLREFTPEENSVVNKRYSVRAL